MFSHATRLFLLLGSTSFTNALVMTGLHKRDTHAQITVGRTKTPLGSIDGIGFVRDSLNKLCSDAGCDSGTPNTLEMNAQFESYGDIVGCTWSVTASGNFDNADQRDYMISLLTTSFDTGKEVETITISIEDNPLCTHQGQPTCSEKDIDITSGVNYQQVVLNLDNGANTAQLDYHLDVVCRDSGGFDCDKFLTGNVKDGLSAVPGVGLAYAQIIDLVCAPAA